jgi:hypothetical protein
MELAHAHLTGVRDEHRRVRLTRVHIQTDETHSLHRHGRLLLCSCGRRAGTSRYAAITDNASVPPSE